MATNENVNKVIYGNQTVMDITDTTAEEADVASGEVFYKASGERSVGTLNVDSAVWGQITGDIEDQSDLMNELGKKVIKLTQAQYNALSSAEKHDTDKVYYIYDYSPTPITLINDAVTSLTSTWSSSKLSDDLDDKVDKVSGKGLSTNDFTSEEKTKLAGLQNYDDTQIRSMIPTATSQLTNNSGFITNAVNNLINYYLKSETYTKEEVNSLISTLSGIHFEYVATLPTENIQTNAIYLVPKADTQSRNVKEEYINLDGTTAGWEKIGDTDIDLSDYVTITELNTALADYVTSSAFTTALATKSTQVRLTKAQYDALTEEEKHDTTKVYYITDYTPMPVNAELNDSVTASDKVWSSQKVASELSGISTHPNMVWLCATLKQVLPENITDSSKWELGIGISTISNSTYLEDNTAQGNYYLSSVRNTNITWDVLREGHYTSLVAILFLKGTNIQTNPKKVVIGSIPLNLLFQVPSVEDSDEYYFWTPDFKTQLCSGGYYAFGRIGIGKSSSLNYPTFGVKMLFIGEGELIDASVDKWDVTLYAI